MQITTPEDFREIIPDAPDVPVSQVTWAERELLNRQSGFNRSLLEAHETCGCFHCGRRFPTSLVTEWMAEDGQEDTGICPYCGTDALIVGTADIPLSTSLLTRLYEEWFGRELKEREYDPHLLAPPYGNHDDYLRKGIPFRMETVEEERRRIEREELRTNRESLLEGGGSVSVSIWSVGDPGDGRWDCEGTHLPGNASGHDINGTWCVSAYEDDECMDHFELATDAITLRFSPWNDREQGMLIELSKRYGKRLMGDLTCNGDQDISLSVYLRDA